MQFTAAQIAELIHGTIEGDPNRAISTISRIEEAGPEALSFIANPKYEHFLPDSRAGILIINDALNLSQPPPEETTLIRVPDAYAAFALLMENYQQLTGAGRRSGIEQPSFIDESAQLGKNIYIGAFSYIGSSVKIGDNVQIFPQVYIGDNVQIGSGTLLYPGVKVYANTIIGAAGIIHSGTVIGSDGFGFAPQADGTFKKVPQLGRVIIGDHVEIGANTTIDKATLGATKINNQVKLDNLIQIAHNVVIDENTAIAAQAGISGSTKIGKNCMIGGQAGIVGHIRIADGTKINAQSGVSKGVTQKNTAINGSPAFDYKNSLKSQAIFRNLPDWADRLQVLEKKLAALSNRK